MSDDSEAVEKFPGYPAHLAPGLEVGPTGEIHGRDSRKMTVAELNALGHEKSPLLKIIRAKCLDCAHSESEVRKCTGITTCALWPYRMRTNPFSERTASPAAAEALANWRAKKRAECLESEEAEDEE